MLMGELRAQIDLPMTKPAPTAARHAIVPILTAWGLTDDEWLHDARLLVTELVANAVRHGGGCVELSLSLQDRQVTIRVADGSAVVPRRRDPADDGGRGLVLIEALAAAWGVENYQGGKRVWVRLRQPPTPSSPGRGSPL
jgi:anti-sigma regulatory factor (Ser/Thr protein kinase)